MIKNKLKKILKLSNIFLKDSFENLDIINNNTQKLNKKSIFLWMFIVMFFALFYMSQKTIKFLLDRELGDTFLNIYFLIIAIFFIFQTILVVINVFYFSKDLEFILPLPLKPIEILIAKFITLLLRLYIFEMLFGIIPITMYGIYSNSSILFYFYEILIFIVFPIFPAAVICIIMMFVMKTSKFIKNKDLFQIIITLLMIVLMSFLLYKLLGNMIVKNKQIEYIEVEKIETKIIEFNNKIKEVNKYFLAINPSVETLKASNIKSIIEIIKILFMDVVSLTLFLIIGKITYLKDILKNTIYLNNKTRKTNVEKKCKKRDKNFSYIAIELKTLFKNPMFFIQCVFPSIIFTISFCIMAFNIIPKFREMMQIEEFKNYIGNISFSITSIYIILGIIQIFFMISPISLTGISRGGKNANFIKYIPISLYRQFINKSIPQMIINIIPSITILCVIHILIPEIELKYIFEIFGLSLLLNIINSNTMLIIDILNPKTEWDTEYAVLKQNNNKIFQYTFTVLIMLLLVYLKNILKNNNIEISILITAIIFILIIFVINIIVKIKSKKLFKKII